MVLEHFDVTPEDYAVVFTANATHALQIVADSYIFEEKTTSTVQIGSTAKNTGPTFAYLRDSHNSLVGMREIVKDKINSMDNGILTSNRSGLFAMTAMSNFCGRKYDLALIKILQDRGWSVCLDAASWVSTSHLSLAEIRPHFMALSFYKMFDSMNRLKARAFAGGTVSQMLVDELHSVIRNNHERYEQGTLNYYAISALTKGFADLKRFGGIQTIQENNMRIAAAAHKMLSQKVHWNGKPAVKVYGWRNPAQQGPIVTFNLLRDDGSFTGYSEVEKMASLFGIDLRTGCFCNSGACQMYLEIGNNQLRQYYEEGKECGDTRDVIDGRPTGAVRVSFGRQSTIEDVLILEQMIDYCFLGFQPSTVIEYPLSIEHYTAAVSRLIVYPVKSCQGFDLEKCTLTRTGLQHDREFMIESCGTTLTQKRQPKMCKIHTMINKKSLELFDADNPSCSVTVPLQPDQISLQSGIVCTYNVQTSESTSESSSWLTSFLNLPECKLRRVHQDSSRSLSNEAPYLVVNEASIKILADIVDLTIEETVDRFRPNIVIRGLPPFIEDTAKRMSIDGFKFEIIKKCTRCEMICVNPETGVKEPQLIVALRNFRQREKMTFGIYVKQIEEIPGEIHRDSKVHFE
ncbi:unnamed protein product [Cylicocyclus nassatus]|uniref:MOSC domain-containing protein n=1 Tax=Cylicocyclus nassatus TaxID=53992 RepID=A0AA36HE29_CYLNA|nr:unnamed protein product [Cylicocyclus nassatus]